MIIMVFEVVGELFDFCDLLLWLSNFFDDGSVELLYECDCFGVLVVVGIVNGVCIIVFCIDGIVMGGVMGVEGCMYIVNVYDIVIEDQSFIVGIWYLGGVWLVEGVWVLYVVGQVFEVMICVFGYILQILVVVGFVVGGVVYGLVLIDVVVMVLESWVFVIGFDVVCSVIGEDVDMVLFGGLEIYYKKFGVCYIVVDDEFDVYDCGCWLVGLFCQQGYFDCSKVEVGDIGIYVLLLEFL